MRVNKVEPPGVPVRVHTPLPVPVEPCASCSCNSPHELESPALSKHQITCRNSLNATDNSTLPTIVAITPTYKRLTQKLDLVSLCSTVMHIPGFLWIVIEDSKSKSSLVANVLGRCRVNFVHLNVATSAQTKKAGQRGVEQRNAGLDWARKYCKEHCSNNCSGVIYFMDDDNRYDLRLFAEVSKSMQVGIPSAILCLTSHTFDAILVSFIYPLFFQHCIS